MGYYPPRNGRRSRFFRKDLQGGNHPICVPADVSKAIGGRAAHLPLGEVEGLPLRSTLVSRGRGCYRSAIHGEIRKKLRVDAGAVVEIAMERAEESREPPLPPALVLALRNSPTAQAALRKMATAPRRQVVR
jgi:Domain of unknown function (DUF1905)